ncbi:MAG: hypothetical protein ACJ79S_07545 [Gemmatimonadaceae bacterium]
MDGTICEAIRGRRLLIFEYADLMRVVEPHLYGINSAEHEALTAWLRPGNSRVDPQGGWRNYLVADMHHVQILDERFDGPRAGYNARDPRLVRIFCALPPGSPGGSDG